MSIRRAATPSLKKVTRMKQPRSCNGSTAFPEMTTRFVLVKSGRAHIQQNKMSGMIQTGCSTVNLLAQTVPLVNTQHWDMKMCFLPSLLSLLDNGSTSAPNKLEDQQRLLQPALMAFGSACVQVSAMHQQSHQTPLCSLATKHLSTFFGTKPSLSPIVVKRPNRTR